MTDNERLNQIKNAVRETSLFGQFLSDIEWLIEQAERSRIYKKALVSVASHKPMSDESGIASGALIEADLKFDK